MRVINSGHKEVRKCHTGKRSRVISGNLPRLIAAHRDGHHEVLLLSASVFEGVEKGELKRAAPTRSVRSLRPSTQEAAVLPSPTLFWICERAGDGGSAA